MSKIIIRRSFTVVLFCAVWLVYACGERKFNTNTASASPPAADEQPAVVPPPPPPPPEAIKAPVRISAAIDDSTIAVTDYGRQKVYIVDKTDLSIKNWITMGGLPSAVAWSNGVFYIGNDTAGTVEAYDLSGAKLFSFGAGAGSIKLPSDIAVDEINQNIYVVDAYDKIVKVFDMNGTLLRTIPSAGANPVILAYPTAIAIDNTRGQIIVSDYGNTSAFPKIKPRLQIFNFDGSLANTINGATGMFTLTFTFSRPQGIAVDQNNHIYLVDSLRGEVLVFDRNSFAVLKTIGSFGSQSGQLLLPLDVFVDGAAKDIYVTDNRNRRITVFRGEAL